MSEFTNNLLENTKEMKPIMDIISQIMEIPDEKLTPALVESVVGSINGGFTPSMKELAVKEFIQTMESEGFSNKEAKDEVEAAKTAITDFITDLKPSETRKELFDQIFNIFYEIFDEALDRYHNYDIVLPIALSEGAKVPTYAHNTDDAADLYALETVTLAPHSLGNMIHTGVKIALPERWAAYIVPRSSMGIKTPLRLSNNMGVIDSGYRGELCVLYDNISDSEYVINAGDRIAQLIVKPSYHFKPYVVDALEETERGEGGFGSSGK